MTAWEDYQRRINQAAQLNRDNDDFLSAQRIIKTMPDKAVHDVFARLTQREIERARDLRSLCGPAQPKPAAKPSHDYEPTFADLYEHPQKWHRGRINGIYLNAKEREKFHRWCTRENKNYSGWLATLLDTAPPGSRESVRLDWIPGYRTADMQERDQRFWATSMRYIEQFAQEIRLEVTAELLGEKFTLADGRVLSWRDATIDDHEQRVTELAQTITASGEEAAMHRQAVELLRTHDAKTLGEIDHPREDA